MVLESLSLEALALQYLHIQKPTKDTIEKALLPALQAQINMAKQNSSFYSTHLPANRSLKDLSSLVSLPFITGKDIQENGERMLCTSLSDIARIRTSGTTASPKRIYFTAKDLARTVQFFAVGMRPLVTLQRPVAILMGSASPYSIASLLKEGLECSGVKGIIFEPTLPFQALCKELVHQNPSCLVGMPAQMLYLSYKIPTLRPKTVLLSADYAPQSLIQTIEKNWHTRVILHYGLTETGYGCAVQCLQQKGQHIRSGEFYLEIVHPKTGKVLPQGHTGELVITTLQNEAMPLIRYRTGDIASLQQATCTCGTHFPVLGVVQGRLYNHQKAYNIHTLDETLYALQGLHAYTAQLYKGRLCLTIEGEIDKQAVQAALAQTVDITYGLASPFVLHNKRSPKRTLEGSEPI